MEYWTWLHNSNMRSQLVLNIVPNLGCTIFLVSTHREFFHDYYMLLGRLWPKYQGIENASVCRLQPSEISIFYGRHSCNLTLPSQWHTINLLKKVLKVVLDMISTKNEKIQGPGGRWLMEVWEHLHDKCWVIPKWETLPTSTKRPQCVMWAWETPHQCPIVRIRIS